MLSLSDATEVSPEPEQLNRLSPIARLTSAARTQLTVFFMLDIGILIFSVKNHIPVITRWMSARPWVRLLTFTPSCFRMALAISRPHW